MQLYTLCWQKYNVQTVELTFCLMLMTLIHFNSHPIQCLQDSQLSNRGDLIFPFNAALKIVRATESIFRKRVAGQNMGINIEKNLDLKIGVLYFNSLGQVFPILFPGHFFEKRLGIECAYLSSLLKIITKKFWNLQLKTYGKSTVKWWFIKTNHPVDMNLQKEHFFKISKLAQNLIISCCK